MSNQEVKPEVKQANVVISFGVSTTVMQQVKTCFAQEPEEVRDMLKKLAKTNGRDYLMEYVNFTFLRQLDAQYQKERIAFVKSRLPIIQLAVSNGADRDSIMAALNLDEGDLELATTKAPTRGAGKKLADITRLLGAK
jgi:hypothetical protein